MSFVKTVYEFNMLFQARILANNFNPCLQAKKIVSLFYGIYNYSFAQF